MDSAVYRPAKREDMCDILDILRADDTDDIYRLYSPAVLESFYRITRDNPDGFVVAEVEGRVVGVVIAHVLGPNLCFVGMNTVTKQHRGKGIGRRLFDTITRFVGGRELSLACEDYNLEEYARKGITHVGHKIEYYAGRLDASSWAGDDEALAIVGLEDVEASSLVEYDISIGPRGSTNIVDAYLSCEGVVTAVAMKHGEIVGYGAMDISHLRANRIGPLYANTSDIAKAILARLTVIGKGREGFLCSPYTGNGFESMLVEAGYTLRHSGFLLSSHELNPVPAEKVFGSANYAIYIA